MKYVFKQGEQRNLILEAVKKAGSERKLSRVTGISTGALYRYKFEKAYIPHVRLNKILRLLGKNFGDIRESVKEKLSDSWGQKKGGLLLIKKKKSEGTFEETIEKLKQLSSERMKQWHAKIRAEDPLKYHTTQYDRFKKIGGYSVFCGNIKVRNQLEAQIANFLNLQNVKFEYEPCLLLNGKAYFPDFKIGNLIIEATFWSRPKKDKIDYLKTKVKAYKSSGYNILFFVPDSHRNFYKQIGSTLVSNLQDLRGFMPR